MKHYNNNNKKIIVEHFDFTSMHVDLIYKFFSCSIPNLNCNMTTLLKKHS